MENIQVKPIHSNGLLNNLEKDLTEGVILSKGNDLLVLKTDKYKSIYSFVMGDGNSEFVITKDNRLVFIALKTFFKQVIDKYKAFGGKKLPKDFISKDDDSITIKFKTEDHEESENNVINIVYKQDSITFKMTGLENNKPFQYKGVDIKVYQSLYYNVYKEIEALITNLNNLFLVQQKIDVANLNSIMTVAQKEDAVEIAKDNKKLTMENGMEGVTLVLDKGDYTFQVSDETLEVTEKKMYAILESFIKILEIKVNLNKDLYPNNFINNGVITYRDFTGNTLVIKKEDKKITIDVKRVKPNEDLVELMKLYGEEEILYERKITVDKTYNAYPGLGEYFQKLFTAINENLGYKRFSWRR